MMNSLDPNQLVEMFKHSARRFPQQAFEMYNADGSEKSLKEQVEARDNFAENLYEKYSKYVADMPDNWTKRATVLCMEAWTRATKYLDESTKASAIVNFNKNAMGLIRTVLPATATEKAFSLQSMLGPVSTIFVLTPNYATTTNKVTAGTPLFGSVVDPSYGDSNIEDEEVGTGTGAQVIFTFTLGNTPVIKGTVLISVDDDGLQLADTGAGTFAGDGTGTINYTTGQCTVTFNVAPTAGAVVTTQYTVDNETNENAIPEVDLTLSAFPVTATRKAIRFRYSLVAAYSMQDQYGLSADAELTSAVGAEIAYGIDINNFTVVVKNAIDKTSDPAYTFDAKYPVTATISRKEFYEGITYFFTKGSTEINVQSGKFIANGMVASAYVIDLLTTIGLPRFAAVKLNSGRGIQVAGEYDGRWTILRTPNPGHIKLGADEVMLYSKMDEFLFAAYVWAPLIAAFETPLTILDDMQARKGMASLYAKKLINNKAFLKMKVANLL